MTITKRADYVTKSQPSLTRPRLRTESEQRFADVEQRSAACYADAEGIAESLNDLARQIEAVPTLIDLEEPSAVHHMSTLERVATPPVVRDHVLEATDDEDELDAEIVDVDDL